MPAGDQGPPRGMDGMRLVIADDDDAIRQRLRELAESLGARIVAEVKNGYEAIDVCELLIPDLILLDVAMPLMGGFPAARHLRTSMPGISIVFVSQYADAGYAEEALRIGAQAYVMKSAAATELQEAVDAIAAGQCFVSPMAAK